MVDLNLLIRFILFGNFSEIVLSFPQIADLLDVQCTIAISYSHNMRNFLPPILNNSIKSCSCPCTSPQAVTGLRSEERRVGKEC